MSSFTPAGYEQPKSNNNYFNVSKLTNGTDNVIRILSKPIMGWLDWDNKKPIRTEFHENKPLPIDPTKPVKHFWAMIVWDYAAKALKIMEITQASIQETLINLDCDEAWGDPTGYDLNIKKAGEKLDTKYTVTPRPPKPLAKEINDAVKESNIDLNQLFVGGDPFATDQNAKEDFNIEEAEDKSDIDIKNIPF